ncbi:MAG: bacillithiol system redox-active protein YtxJ [Winogradskyella sp.]|uniref:bacillithiol system redox-active protein YtxJ n=1 Tax=Winogradskyella sp. TaxID=1883156 RepID=UPI00182F90D9|nr:bacillithiol system redox-active protein YtxJ [Winogradskyella sp.]
MGIFNKIFSGSSESKEEKTLPWNALTDSNQLQDIVENSKTKTQLIFKHSTRCGISRMVMNHFVSAYDPDLNVDLYYLDLLNYREVSNKIRDQFGVIHESPQLLIIKNGEVVTHASHGAINDIDIARYL